MSARLSSICSTTDRSLPPECSTKRPPPVSSTHHPRPAQAISPGCSANASARTQNSRSPWPPGRVPLTLRIRLPGGITEESVTRLKSATPACCSAWSNADRSVRPAPDPVRIEMSSPPASGRVLCNSSSRAGAIRSSSRRRHLVFSGDGLDEAEHLVLELFGARASLGQEERPAELELVAPRLVHIRGAVDDEWCV